MGGGNLPHIFFKIVLDKRNNVWYTLRLHHQFAYGTDFAYRHVDTLL